MMKEERPSAVVVLNAEDLADWLARRCVQLPVELRHAAYRFPWEQIAARRAGEITQQEAVPEELRRSLTDAEIVFGFFLPLGLSAMAPRLQWLETPAAGYDQLNGTGVLESDVAVTTLGSVYAAPVAEHVFALLFGLWRRLDEFRAAQRQSDWKLVEVRELQGATMAIVGLGNIGTALARAAKAFGMRVIGTRRRVTERPECVDQVFHLRDLRAMLAKADVVVLAVSGTAETANLIGAAELAAMQRTACLINVSRGIVVDEEALARALSQGTIAAAGLDVFQREPLPAGSPLWQLPNVIITPHVAVNIPSRLRRAIEHFADNLERHLAGQPLLDRIGD